MEVLTTALAAFLLKGESVFRWLFLTEESTGGIFFFWNCLEAEGGVREKDEDTRRLWALLLGGTKTLAFWRALFILDISEYKRRE